METMTVKEVASVFGVHVQTIHRWAKTGRLKAVKVGHDWRFDRRAIESALRGEAS